MKKLLLIAFILAMTSAPAIPMTAASKPTFNPVNGHYYLVVSPPTGIDWDNAKRAAETQTYKGMKGHLATITSACEQAFVMALNSERDAPGELWLGGKRSDTDHSTWQWITGENWDFSYWNISEPNNSNGQENRLGMWVGTKVGDLANGRWNDFSQFAITHFTPFGYVIEFE